MKKKVLSFSFLIIVFALTLWSVFKGEDISQVIAHLSATDIRYIIPAVMCVLGFIISESVIIYYLMRTFGIKMRFRNCCRYSFVGFFYSCITPSAGGGQPMQVVEMRQDGIPVAVSAITLAIITIMYKMVLVLLGAVVLLLRPDSIMCFLEPVLFWVILGLCLNVVWVSVLLMLVFRPKVVRKLSGWILRLGVWLRLIRNRGKMENRVERILAQYEGTSDYFRTHTHVIIHVFLMTMVQRTILFLVTWLTYKSFHLQGSSVSLITTLQGMIAVSVDMIPLPGGMGISEKLFLEVFSPIFSENLVLSGMVVSRGISFYSQLLISAAVTACTMFVRQIKRKKGGKA